MVLMLLADSQVGRVWRMVNQDRECFKTAQFVSVLKDSQRIEAMSSITPQIKTIVFSCLTNVICDQLASAEDGRLGALNLLFEEFFRGASGVNSLCTMLPGIEFFVAPPNVRNVPSWYPKFRCEILRELRREIISGPNNLHLLPDFEGELESDGVHYQIVHSISYIKFIADEVEKVMSRPREERGQGEKEVGSNIQGALLNGLTERVTQVEDRLTDLDARHSEEADCSANERDLHRFIISGLKRLGKPSQDELRRLVFDFIKQLVDTLELDDIVWVRPLRSTVTNIFNVECKNVAVASSVKSSFAHLIKTSSPPAFIGRVSISFCHSLGTRVRLSLLRAIAKCHREKNPQAICSVTSFTARPVLRIGSQGKGVRFLTYVESIRGFGHLLTQDDLDRAASMCRPLKGALKARFICLDDDRLIPPNPRAQKRGAPDVAEPMDSQDGPPSSKRS